jgi:hypothetical protein
MRYKHAACLGELDPVRQAAFLANLRLRGWLPKADEGRWGWREKFESLPTPR